MKVIGIMSSPRGRNSATNQLVKAALEGAKEAGAKVEAIDVARLKISPCKGCANCHMKGRCAQDDDFWAVREKLVKADGIVLGSPNYIDNVNAQMKLFMDRMVDAIHTQLLEGKYGFSVCTAGGGNQDLVIEYMNEFLIKCGAMVIGGAGAAVGRDPPSINVAAAKARELGQDLVRAIEEKRNYPEQEKLHNLFKQSFAYTLRARKDQWAANYVHWQKKGLVP